MSSDRGGRGPWEPGGHVGGATFPRGPRLQAAPQRGLGPQSAPMGRPCFAATAELFSGWILAPHGDVCGSPGRVPVSPSQARHQLPLQLQRQNRTRPLPALPPTVSSLAWSAGWRDVCVLTPSTCAHAASWGGRDFAAVIEHLDWGHRPGFLGGPRVAMGA